MMQYNIIDSLDKLCSIFEQQKIVNFYGAGVRLYLFFQTMDECGLDIKADRIIVSSAKGNPEKIRGIPVVEFTQSLLTDKDIVLLTLSECYINEVGSMLKSTKAEIYQIDFDVIDSIPSDDVLKCIAPFINNFSMKDVKWNAPDGRYPKSAWGMWWQGEENAPDIVKACWKSQRLNLPEGVELRIITGDNFREYIDIPDYILDKYERNLICGAHLSDIIRCCLLYKYGGIWMDATLLLCAPMPKECLEYPIYTRTTFGREFNSKAVWAIWFLCAQSGGEKLFKFVMEAYFYYFQHHDKIKYYLTTDYLIGIACNTFPEICGKLNRIPYNNINAMVLGKHLTETYSETDYNKYIEGTFIQKLTRHGNAYAEDSVYRHIINTYGGQEINGF